MSLIPPMTAAKLPYRVDRSAPGVVRLEKHFGDFNPNCVLGILILVCSIILPAALATTSPLASGLILAGSFVFPGIPVGTVNKKWQIDVNNIGHEILMSRWHDFNKKNKKTSSIKFDDIKEIVAETSPDGTRHRLVIIDQANARHVLHETMNKAHANHFKDDFMDSIELAGSGITLASQVQSQAALSMRQPVVPPSLRQIVVPMLNDAAASSTRQQNDGVPQGIANTLAQDGGARYPMAGGGQGGAVPRDDGSVEAAHARLQAIARHKREVLLRVLEPGTATKATPAVQESTGWGAAGVARVPDPALEHLRNRSEAFNIFDPCFASLGFIPQELAGNTRDFPRVMDGDTAESTGDGHKKKNENRDDEQVITHRPDKRIEKELNVQKVRPTCMVCTRPLKGTNFICPTCETKYCIRCARTLADRKESCWVCRKRIQLA